MKVQFQSDFPVTDAACKQTTGKSLKDWFALLEQRGGTNLKRRDTVNWLHAEMDKDLWWCTTVWVEYERKKGVVNQQDGLIEGYNICSTKTIAASVTDVYQAFVATPQLKQWFGDNVQARVEAGGTLKDSTGNTAEYLRVRENKDLRFTWNHPKAEAPTRVDVMFADKGKGKTGITLNHIRIQNRAEADGLRAAWGSALDRLKQLLEK